MLNFSSNQGVVWDNIFLTTEPGQGSKSTVLAKMWGESHFPFQNPVPGWWCKFRSCLGKQEGSPKKVLKLLITYGLTILFIEFMQQKAYRSRQIYLTFNAGKKRTQPNVRHNRSVKIYYIRTHIYNGISYS